MLIIPFAIVIAFAVKGSSLYFAKMTLQKAGMQMQKELQLQIMNSILLTDIEAMNKRLRRPNYEKRVKWDLDREA